MSHFGHGLESSAALPFVWVYDNSDLNEPFRKVAEYEHDAVVKECPPLPEWLTR